MDFLGKYEFKRDIFNEVTDAIQKTNTVFLTGPRKCGKTVCLKQIDDESDNTKYVNFKIVDDKQSRVIFENICESIQKNEDIVYLLDEITYAFSPEREIYRIADALTDVLDSKTKIVFTGSQSAALESWANRAFCGYNVTIIKADFLNYAEWLRYIGAEQANEENYKAFLYHANRFYGSIPLEEYLSGCLEETIISNAKTTNYIVGNECDELDTQLLIDVCYAILFTLHNHVSAKTFFSGNKLIEDIRYFFPQVDDFEEPLQDLIQMSFIGSHAGVRKMSLEEVKQAVLFLYRCGLITVTPVTADLYNVPNVYKGLYSDSDFIKKKEDLFAKYNFSIAYPHFYIQVLRSILHDTVPDKLPHSLIGSINECYIRGILPQKECFEYHNIENGDAEIDYVNLRENSAVEITISNKKISKTHFSILPEQLTKVLLSKDICCIQNGIVRIPFYEFAELCTTRKNVPFLLKIKEVERNMQ